MRSWIRIVGITCALGGAAHAWPGAHIKGVPAANARAGAPANALAPGYSLRVLAQGSDPLENPSGVITHFGQLNDFPPQTVEATRTEPDENTYLVLRHDPGGPTAGYDYGHHFLFQGHENGGGLAYVTRINLDVTDGAHRITLLTPVDATTGKTGLGSIDGSTWDPFTRTLLFTQEAGANGGVIELSATWPPHMHTLDGVLGKGGYEGIHPDDLGNLWIVEDAGGTTVKAAKQPNSFVYRFVPVDPSDLARGGALQALQITVDGTPLTFHADASADILAEAQKRLHTDGTTWPVRFVTVHDTATDGFTAFDANAAAKKAGATPLKRPENGQFLPGFGFGSFFFDTTGDTNADAGNQPELAARGAWGAIFRVDLDCSRDEGVISLVLLGDAEHTAFDNLAFADPFTLLVAEDRGDGLHKQLNVLDSVWAIDTFGPPNPRRLIALGRDAASKTDADYADAKTPGFQNDGDNEPTGLHVSDGNASIAGLLGRAFFSPHARWFITQQHGLNQVFEILRP